MNPNPIIRIVCIAMAAVTALAADLPPNGTLLFQNLRTLSSSFRVDNPAVNTAVQDGPKGLAVGDLDGDGRNDMVVGNTDGTVAVLFGGVGGGFEPVIHLPAGSGLSPLGEAGGLRDVIIANVKGDARPEIIAAHPFDEKLYIFSVQGGGFSSLAAVQRLFAVPEVALAGWIHYLAFDLFVGLSVCS